MSGLSRAYRDTSSPLQPLTPLSTNNQFSFRMGGDDSLKPWLDQIDAMRGKRYMPKPPQQQQFQVRVPYMQHGRIQAQNLAPNMPIAARAIAPIPKINVEPAIAVGDHNNVALRQRNRPDVVVLKPNSRLFDALRRVGLSAYWNFFRQHNIDFERFRRLTQSDLDRLGIRNEDTRRQLIKAIYVARTY